MKRLLLFVAVSLVYAPLGAAEPQIDFPSEIARIYDLKMMGQQAIDKGEYDAAAKAYREAMEAQKRILGATNPETLATTRLLAGVFEKQGRWEDACELLGTVFDGQRRARGQAAEDVVWSYLMAALRWGNELCGWVDQPPKDLDRARDLARRLREVSKPIERSLNAENALTYGSLWIEACAEYRSGNAKQAIKVLEPAVQAIPHPYNFLALGLFFGQAGEMDRAHDLVTAAWDMTPVGPATDQDLLDLRGKVVAILYAGKSPPTAVAPAELVEIYDRLLAAYPNADGLYSRRAMCALRVRQWDKASADFRRIVDSQPDSAWNWYHWGAISLHQGNVQEYQRACREVVTRCADSKDSGERHGAVHLVFLGASSGFEVPQLLELVAAHRGRTLNDDWVGLALYRCGRFAEAKESYVETSFGAVEAMAEHRLGNESRAKALLSAAREILKSKRDPDTMFWNVEAKEPWSILEPEILLREAEQLIAPDEKPTVLPPPK